MSELKDYDIMDIEAMDDARLEKSKSGRIQVTRVYIKEEADKAIAEKDKEIAELKSMNESLYLRSGNWKALLVASEKAYKKLMKKFVHEASVAESYRHLIYKEDALNAQEKGDSVNYELLSKKSDNCYRHANRWRGIFKKLNEDK